jgi:nucleotide-binding universal stress UspA family protein
MTERAMVLVAVAGAESEPFWGAVRRLLPPDAVVELFHVIDEAPAWELGMQFARRPGHPRPPDFDARVRDVEGRGSTVVLERALAALGQPAATVVGRGRPEQEIVARAREVSAALVVVAARPGDVRTPAAPHSLGHVSRFVVDHAPCPVLLVRV